MQVNFDKYLLRSKIMISHENPLVYNNGKSIMILLDFTQCSITSKGYLMCLNHRYLIYTRWRTPTPWTGEN